MANDSLSICILFDNVHFVVLELWNIIRHKIVICRLIDAFPSLADFNLTRLLGEVRGQVSMPFDVFHLYLFESYGTY